MKLTNRKNLPQIICDAVANDPYDPGEKTDYSCTTLLKPAHQVALERANPEAMIEDVADRLWAMYGSAAHHIIERGATAEDIIEQRYYGEFAGKTISAQIDHYRDRVISDWKLTSAYKVKKALIEPDPDWTAQLNVQKILMEMSGYIVTKLRIGAMVRDWTKAKFFSEDGYPDQIEYIEIPVWSRTQTIEWIVVRLGAMASPEPCTRAERWQDDPKYALMKVGGKRAVKLENMKHALHEYCTTKNLRLDDGTYYIEERVGPNRRCEFYCSVNKVCPFYQANYMNTEELPFKND